MWADEVCLSATEAETAIQPPTFLRQRLYLLIQYKGTQGLAHMRDQGHLL